MKRELRDNILEELAAMEGRVGFYFKNLVTGENLGYNQREQFLAWPARKTSSAGGHVSDERTGRDGFQRKNHYQRDEKLPGCGVVSHMTGDENGDVTLDIETLYKFMIVISDTTATNALYKHYGNDAVISALKELGLEGTQFNRAFYDSIREEKGIQNYFVPEEIGELLEKMYDRRLVSEKVSEEIEKILLQQQVNHKMGGMLPIGFPIAHKTGEEEDKSHDVGIVYVKEPFIACFASYKTDIPAFEDFIRRTVYEITKDIDPRLNPLEGTKGYF